MSSDAQKIKYAWMNDSKLVHEDWGSISQKQGLQATQADILYPFPPIPHITSPIILISFILNLNPKMEPPRLKSILSLYRFSYNLKLINTKMRSITKSTILDHNKYSETDALYEPLRSTLKKNNINNENNAGSSSVHGSYISNKIYQLNSEQAELLEKQIIIPIDCKLKETNDYSKIDQKKFIVIDVNEKYSQPLTEEEFSRIQRDPVIEEHVYEYASLSNSQPSSVKNSPAGLYHPKQSTLSNALQSKIQQERGSFVKKEYTFKKNKNNSGFSQSEDHLSNLRKVSSEGLLNRQFTNKNSEFNGDHQEIKREERQDKEEGPAKKKRYTSNQNSQITISNGSKQSEQNIETGEYRFRSGTVASSGMRSQNSSASQKGISLLSKKSPYKYNLFSAVDEGVNTGCKSFGKNQLIAREIHNKKWQ